MEVKRKEMPASGTFPSDPKLDYYNLYHDIKRKMEGVLKANRRLQKQAADDALRMQRVLDAYAKLEDRIEELEKNGTLSE